MTPAMLRVDNAAMNEAREELLERCRVALTENLGIEPEEYVKLSDADRRKLHEDEGAIKAVWETIAEQYNCDAAEAAQTAAYIIVQGMGNPAMAGLTILLTGIELGRRQGRAEAADALSEEAPDEVPDEG